MPSYKTWTDYHSKLNLIFHAIVAFSMIPFAWFYLEIEADRLLVLIENKWFTGIVAVVSVLPMPGAYLHRKRGVKAIGNGKLLRDRMDGYFSVLIESFVLLEVTALIAMLGFYLTHSYVFVIIYALDLFFFSVQRPTLDQTARDLLLSKEEKKLLENRDAIE